MKICQLCAVDFTLYHFLLPLLRGLAEAGHEVVAASGDGPFAARVRGEGFRHEPIRISRSYRLDAHLVSLVALTRFFRRERFDLVHVHTPVAALLGRLAARAARVPRIVYTAHGFYFHDRMPAPARAAHIFLEWLGGRLTDTLFTQSEEDAATARRLGLCGDVLAIGNGSDPRRFAPDRAGAARARLRAELGTPPERVVVLTVGRLVAEKGYPELFQAMRGMDAELWAVGPRLENEHGGALDLAPSALPPGIRLLGYRADVADLLRAADIFVLASHREGLPRSIAEAMLTGLPVVATDIRGCREQVVPGATGLLVPPGDAAALAAALGRLVADPAARTRFGEAGLARARAEYDEAQVVARQLAHLGLAR